MPDLLANVARNLSPFLLLVSLLLVCLAILTYRRSHPRPAGPFRWMLPLLRSVSLTLLLVLVWRPVWVWQGPTRTKPRIALLLDRSASMQFPAAGWGGGETRARVVDAMRRSWVGTSGAEVIPLAVADGVAPWDSIIEGRTDLVGALEVLRDGEWDLAILATDGRFTQGSDPLTITSVFPVPIHTVAIGQPVAAPDLAVLSVEAPEIAYPDRPLRIRVVFRSRGLAGQSVAVIVREGSEELARESLVVHGEGLRQEVPLAVPPLEPAGVHFLEVLVSADGEGFSPVNNRRLVGIEVRPRRRQVLMVISQSNWDLTFFRRWLAGQEAFSVEVWEGVSRPQDSPHREEASGGAVEEVDLLVIQGTPERFPAQIRERVRAIGGEDGVGLLVFVAPGSPGRPWVPWRASGMVKWEDTHRGWYPQSVGGSTPLRLEFLSPGTGRARFPSFSAVVGAAARAEGTQVVIWAAPLEEDGPRRPALIVEETPTQRRAYVLAWGWWRWTFQPRPLLPEGDPYDLLWDRIWTWLAQAPERAFRIRPERLVIEAGRSFTVSGSGTIPATVTLSAVGPGGEVVRREGPLPLVVPGFSPGRYRLMAHGRLDPTDETLSATGEVAVEAPWTEFLEADPDRLLLKDLADRTGGTFWPDSFPRPEGFLRSLDWNPPPRVHLVALREKPLIYLALALLLLGEWVLRRRAGLR